MSREIELLTEIRDLLQVMAEPAIAERDVKLRSSLRSVVGKGKKAISAAKLMDGSHSQSAIAKQAGIDQGNLSRLVKALAAAELIATDQKHPRLLVKVPATFFDGDEADE